MDTMPALPASQAPQGLGADRFGSRKRDVKNLAENFFLERTQGVGDLRGPKSNLEINVSELAETIGK
jgi:hypothetical protein